VSANVKRNNAVDSNQDLLVVNPAFYTSWSDLREFY